MTFWICLENIHVKCLLCSNICLSSECTKVTRIFKLLKNFAFWTYIENMISRFFFNDWWQKSSLNESIHLKPFKQFSCGFFKKHKQIIQHKLYNKVPILRSQFVLKQCYFEVLNCADPTGSRFAGDSFQLICTISDMPTQWQFVILNVFCKPWLNTVKLVVSTLTWRHKM